MKKLLFMAAAVWLAPTLAASAAPPTAPPDSDPTYETGTVLVTASSPDECTDSATTLTTLAHLRGAVPARAWWRSITDVCRSFRARAPIHGTWFVDAPAVFARC